MDRRSLSVVACLIALGGVGMYVYERQLIELRAELEEARLREAQAAAAFKRLSEIRRAELKVAREAAQRAGAGWSSVSNDAAAEQARRAAEEAARRAEEEERNRGPRFYREPYRPSQPHAAPARGNAELFSQAQALEREGKGAEAVKIYIRAARSGSGPAAKRLGEIYDEGIAGVAPNYAESLRWRNAARMLGEDVPIERERRSQNVTSAELFAQAQAREREGKNEAAVRLYTQAACAGHDPAAKRLGEIYEKGIDGVPPSYADALVWRNAARAPGEVPLRCKPAEAKAAFEKARAEAEKARLEAERVVRESGEQRSARSLYEEALAHMAAGRHVDAWLLYHRAASRGNADAAARLAESYETGRPHELDQQAPRSDRKALERRWRLYGEMTGMMPSLQQAHLERVHRAEARKWRDAQSAFGEGAPANAQPILQQRYDTGRNLERQGRSVEAVDAYAEAVRSGSGSSARRLYEIYAGGAKGIRADADAARKWHNVALALDQSLPPPEAPDAYSRGPRFYKEPYRIGPPGAPQEVPVPKSR